MLCGASVVREGSSMLDSDHKRESDVQFFQSRRNLPNLKESQTQLPKFFFKIPYLNEMWRMKLISVPGRDPGLLVGFEWG